MSSGQRFMTDLLVSSLMADGGLEAALSQAFRKETQEMEELRVRQIETVAKTKHEVQGTLSHWLQTQGMPPCVPSEKCSQTNLIRYSMSFMLR